MQSLLQLKSNWTGFHLFLEVTLGQLSLFIHQEYNPTTFASGRLIDVGFHIDPGANSLATII